MLLTKLFRAIRAPSAQALAARTQYPLEFEARVNRLHARVPVRQHLYILNGDVRVGAESFNDLFFRCLERTGTMLTPFTVLQRFQTRRDLMRYFLATLDIAGGRMECGAYRGATALLLCHVWRSSQPGFTGDGFYLLDSFSGTSASTAHDLIAVRDAQGHTRMEPFFPAGKTDVTVEMVRSHFADFPDVKICAGWIPEAFRTLPAMPWAFVHLDLTLYEPTLASLRYFYPRLVAGGVIACEGSVFCPGVQQALDDYCAEQDIAYAVLGYQLAVFIKE
jgi:hypothetical protein